MQCNIDARGKFVRMIYGVALLIVGATMIALWARDSQSVLRWVVSGAVTLSGAFAIFESLKGWCIVRAMGFKTSI